MQSLRNGGWSGHPGTGTLATGKTVPASKRHRWGQFGGRGLPDAGDTEEVVQGAEWTVAITVRHQTPCEGGSDPWEALQFLGGRPIDRYRSLGSGWCASRAGGIWCGSWCRGAFAPPPRGGPCGIHGGELGGDTAIRDGPIRDGPIRDGPIREGARGGVGERVGDHVIERPALLEAHAGAGDRQGGEKEEGVAFSGGGHARG